MQTAARECPVLLQGIPISVTTEAALLPSLFRTEYSKIVAVLCARFGMEYLPTAEDVVSDTFLQAAETWGLKGLPPSPVAWLYTVSRNKAVDGLRRNRIFSEKLAPQIAVATEHATDIALDWSAPHIEDSQLAMMFAVCHPAIPVASQIGLALNILCGFGAEEIADAFLTGKETIYKRLARAKRRLCVEGMALTLPQPGELSRRMDAVLATIYLLFNEGYYSASQNLLLRRELCVEAMRLCHMICEAGLEGAGPAHALLALMCFHTSRFDARTDAAGEPILYDDQDARLWNRELIAHGHVYLHRAAEDKVLSRYHLEAAIASLHTEQQDTPEKWERILQLYNRLLQLQYSPGAALNRTYALSKVYGNTIALEEAEKLGLAEHQLYHALLGRLSEGGDDARALRHWAAALALAKTERDRKHIRERMEKLSGGNGC